MRPWWPATRLKHSIAPKHIDHPDEWHRSDGLAYSESLTWNAAASRSDSACWLSPACAVGRVRGSAHPFGRALSTLQTPTVQRKVMTSKKTNLERQKLFDEAWATPVTKLAKTYGLSDVGLRKICAALDVPLPPRGYWAKLAAGKTIPKPALHKTTHPTTYERVMHVVVVDEVLEERVAKARASPVDTENSKMPDYSPPLDPAAFSQQAKLVIRAMKGVKLEEGAFSSLGVTWGDISVSPDLKERALQLVDRFAHELYVVGAKFENAYPPLPTLRRGMRREAGSKRNCFTLHGQRYFVRIQERITQELVPPPPPKPLRCSFA